jgi:hypothetical protein
MWRDQRVSDQDQITDRNLQALIKALKGKLPQLFIGVMGDKDHRKEGGLTNAVLGQIHEFGEGNMPARSWLRVPITDHMQKALEKSGFFDGDVARKMMETVMKDKSLVPIIEKIGIVGEAIIQEGFDSGGFGKWPASDMTKKKVHQTLVETSQLRNSIGSEVKE